MIHQISAHTRQHPHRVDAVGVELIRRADARQHEQLGRTDGTGSKQHLSARCSVQVRPLPLIVNAGCARTFVRYLSHVGMGHDVEVRSLRRRRQVGTCGTAPRGRVHGHLEITKAFLLVAVEIGAQCVACLLARLEEHVIQRIGFAPVCNGQWTVVQSGLVEGDQIVVDSLAAVGLTGFGAPAKTNSG